MNITGLLAGFAAGALGAMGLGGGSVLILYLTLYMGMEQAQAQGINLAFFIPCAAIAVLLHARKRQICWSLWLYAAPVGTIGALLGVALGRVLGGEVLRVVFACFLTVFGLCELLHRKKAEPKKKAK